MLELQNITKTFTTGEAVTPIRNIDLKIEKGKITTISGESGTGKSTLLMIIGGLLKPTEGKVLLQGKDLWSLNDQEISKLRSKTYGYLFQSSVMIKALTIAENIEFAAKVAGKDISKKEIEELLDNIGIKDKKNSLPHTLSGGQRRRAMLAINHARDPEMIIADEPTNDLDKYWKEKTLDFFKEWRDMGKTIILASHDPEVEALGEIKYKIIDSELKLK